MASRWTHNQCSFCWLARQGPDRRPVQLADPEEETCCFCGDVNADGIYVRCDPAAAGLVCGGGHGD